MFPLWSPTDPFLSPLIRYFFLHMPPDGRSEPAPFPLPASSSSLQHSRSRCIFVFPPLLCKREPGLGGGEGTAKEEDWCSPSLRSETIVEGRGGGRRKGGVCTYAGCTYGAHRQKRRGNEEVGTFRHGECGKEGRIANPKRASRRSIDVTCFFYMKIFTRQ